MPAVHLNEGENVGDSDSCRNGVETSYNTPLTQSVEELQTENEPDATEESEEEKEEKSEWVDILGSGQLKMKVLKKGQPDTRPQPPDICHIKLKAVLDDGTIVEEHESLEIQLSCHEVVQGIELTVPLMEVEEEAVVVVGPRFGYGSIGNPPKIPPNATITYNITLLKSEPEPDLESIPFEKRKEMANIKKERGNWWYSRQDATKAIQCYRKGIDILDETTPFCNQEGKSIDCSEEEAREVIKQKLLIYNNLAAAQLMIEAYESALMSVNRVLQWDPKNVKALFRKGKILKAKGEIDQAVDIIREAFLLEPENSAVKIELSRCVKVQQAEIQHEKNLYKKMLGQDKKDDKSSDVSKVISQKSVVWRNTSRKTSSWTKILGTAATATVMVAIAVAVGYRFKNYSFL